MTLKFLRLIPFAVLALPGVAMAGQISHAETPAMGPPVIKVQILEEAAAWVEKSFEACELLSKHDACEFVNPNDGLTVDGTCLSMWSGTSVGVACLPLERAEDVFDPEELDMDDFVPEIEQS